MFENWIQQIMAEEETEVTVDEDVPENFAARIVRDVMVIFQKQMDLDVASVEAAAYIWKNTGTPGKVGYFIDATENVAGSSGNRR